MRSSAAPIPEGLTSWELSSTCFRKRASRRSEHRLVGFFAHAVHTAARVDVAWLLLSSSRHRPRGDSAVLAAPDTCRSGQSPAQTTSLFEVAVPTVDELTFF